MRKVAIVSSVVLAAVIMGIIFALSPRAPAQQQTTPATTEAGAIANGVTAFNTPLTLTVIDKWVDRETEHTYYLISGTDAGGNYHVIELEASITAFLANPDTDYGMIARDKTYDFTCTGWENEALRQNFVCQLVK